MTANCGHGSARVDMQKTDKTGLIGLIGYHTTVSGVSSLKILFLVGEAGSEPAIQIF
jgi:hypothetical protein